VLKVDGSKAEGAAINVFGGKLTTSRRLAESVLEKIEDVLGKKGPAWTKVAKFPGGDFEPLAFDAEVRRLAKDYAWLPPKLAYRLTRLYGTRARVILGDAAGIDALAPHFGADLYGREVDYLVANEWARTAQDVLWRRTKVGLRVGPADVERLEAYLARAA
jgi:glycerol-3-phosphate dehydrogenase